jgi:hypothetical protein
MDNLGLARTVADLISAHSLESGNRFLTQTNNIVISSIDDLNRFWRVELAQLQTDTLQARECLCRSHDFRAWLENFRAYVLPIIVEHNLPRIS